MLDDLLLNNNKKQQKRRKKRLRKFFSIIFLVALICIAIISFADTGDKFILALAQKNLLDNYGISLSTEKITGNPLKGYSLENFFLKDKDGGEFSYGKSLTWRIDFREMFKGNLKLANFNASDAKIFFHSLAFDVSKLAMDFRKHSLKFNASANSTPINGNFDITDEILDRGEIDFGTYGKILATGSLADLHVSAENLNLKEIFSVCDDCLSSKDFSGFVNFNADISGGMEAPKIAGNFHYLGTKIYGLPIERFSANVKFLDNKFSASEIQASALDIPIQGGFEVEEIFSPRPFLQVKLDGTEANIFRLDKILGFSQLKELTGKISEVTANFSGYVDALEGLAKIKAPRISYDGKTFRDINAKIKFSGNDIAEIDARFNFLGGDGKLNGRAKKIYASPELDIGGEILNVDFDRIEYMLPNEERKNFKIKNENEKVSVSFAIKGRINEPEISFELEKLEGEF